MALPVGMFNVSVLVAPVATPLYAAMAAQGRIVSDEVLAQFPSANLITNLLPAKMSRDDLYVGAKWLISKLFDPGNFYARIEAMAAILAPPPWVRLGAGRPYRHPSRREATALYSTVLRRFAQRDGEFARLVRRVFALMKARPEIRTGLNDALSHYAMTLRCYELNGVYNRDWSRLTRPPFGTATTDERLERIRAHA